MSEQQNANLNKTGLSPEDAFQIDNTEDLLTLLNPDNMNSIRLIAHTQQPLESLYSIWEGSKHGNYFDPAEVPHMIAESAEVKEDFEGTMGRILQSAIPIARAVSFTFECKDTPLAWREHLVRHVVGTAFWAQSSRVLDLRNFQYYTPPAVAREGGEEGIQVYREAMESIREGYTKLRELGVPEEDAKMLMPEGRLQTIYFTVNYEALAGIMRKRSCWVAQADMWQPIILKFRDEMAKVDPILASYAAKPPCQLGSKHCPHAVEANTRMFGKDPLPACPLYAGFTGHVKDFYEFIYPHQLPALNAQIERYGNFWAPEYAKVMKRIVSQPYNPEDLGKQRISAEDRITYDNQNGSN